MTSQQTPKNILKEIKVLKTPCINCGSKLVVCSCEEILSISCNYCYCCDRKLQAISSNDEKWKQKIKEEIEKIKQKEVRFVDNICKRLTLEELKTSLLKDETEKTNGN